MNLLQKNEISVSKNYISNYLTYITIGFIYALFISLVIDKFTNSEIVEKDCKGSYYFPSSTPCADRPSTGFISHESNDACEVRRKKDKKCHTDRETVKLQKYTYMMVIGIVSIIAGIITTRLNDRYKVASLGLTLGGVFTIFYFNMVNWGSLSDNRKLAVLGLSLSGLVYASVRLYK